MAGPGRSHRQMLGRIAGLDGKLLFPVLPVAVDDLDGDGRADGFAVAYTAEDMGFIRFDLHAAATAVALLTPPELAVDEFEIDGNPGRQSGDKGDQGLPVRLSGG